MAYIKKADRRKNQYQKVSFDFKYFCPTSFEIETQTRLYTKDMLLLKKAPPKVLRSNISRPNYSLVVPLVVPKPELRCTVMNKNL